MIRNRVQYPALSEPVRLPGADFQVSSWHTPLSEPKRKTSWQLAAAAIIASGIVYVGEPIVSPDTSIQEWQGAQTKGTQAPLFDVTRSNAELMPSWWMDQVAKLEPDRARWFPPFAEPVREVPIVPAALMSVWDIDRRQLTLPERTQVDKWYRPLSEPLFAAPPLPTAAKPSFWMDQEAKLEVDIVRWLPPLSEPVRTVMPLSIGARPSYWLDPFPRPPVVGLDLLRWWVQPSEPVRVRPQVHASILPIFFEDTEPPTPEVIFPDKWHQPLSERLRVLPPLPVGATPSWWMDYDLLTRPEQSQVDKWFRPLSEPLFVMAPLPMGARPFHWLDPFPRPFVPSEIITMDKWYRSLSEPLFDKAPLPVEVPYWSMDADALTRAETTLLSKWYRPLSEPLFAVPPLPSATKPFFWYDPVSRLEEDIIRWYWPLSEPPAHLIPARTEAALVPHFWMDQEAKLEVDRMRWWPPFSEPVREVPVNPAALMPVWVIDPFQLTLPEVTTLDKWYRPFSEPMENHKVARWEATLIASGLYLQGPPVVITTGHIKATFRLFAAVDGTHQLLVAVDGTLDLRDDC